MSVSLTEDQLAFVRRLVESGRYASEKEVLETALERLEEDERALDEIRRKLQQGIDQADRGELEAFDQTLVERIKAEGREALAARRRAAADA